MGQFASTAFNGDPYIDIMRELPDKELVWWVQKVIWLAQGYTFLEHFARTYPTIFLHRCDLCNGAGCVTCPSCRGRKVLTRRSATYALPHSHSASRALANADVVECTACGTYCEWDAESEWQDKFKDWESKLAYYDRTYGPLFDEWYEDIANEGNLEEDTPPPDEKWERPDPSRTDALAQRDREFLGDKKRLAALMKRYGGHPYDSRQMLGYKMVDPTVSLGHNVVSLMANNNYLPLELQPELQVDDAAGATALEMFNDQMLAEFFIMNNLDAAIKDQPKPCPFSATAGTVPCPQCDGQPWAYSVMPNFDKLMCTETPYWTRTLQRMNSYWTLPGQKLTLETQPGGAAGVGNSSSVVASGLSATDGYAPAATRAARIALLERAAASGGGAAEGVVADGGLAGDGSAVAAAAVSAAAAASTSGRTAGRAYGEWARRRPVVENDVPSAADLVTGRNDQTQLYRAHLNRMVRGEPTASDPNYMYDYGTKVVPDPLDGNDPEAISSAIEDDMAFRQLPQQDQMGVANRAINPILQEKAPGWLLDLKRRRRRKQASEPSVTIEEAQ